MHAMPAVRIQMIALALLGAQLASHNIACGSSVNGTSM